MTSIDTGEYPVREAFRRFYPEYIALHPHISPERAKTAECIMKCKTGELGYDIGICEDCGRPVVHAVSCNNRSCPCCQAPLEKKWEAERNTELIDGIAYYHVVFTVPHKLNPLFRANEKLLYALLFTCVKDTLVTLCADPRFMGATPGIVGVLHTWGQKLNYHPHIHVCLSGGGVTKASQFVETRHKGFLLPERAVAAMFRGKFICALRKLYNDGKLDLSMARHLHGRPKWERFMNALYETRWLPFVKETFNGRGNAIKYLARYSYRTAIANSRIVSVDKETVTFRYKDYADGTYKTKTVAGVDFIGMFLQHILPSGFHRVRFSGYLSNSRKARNLKLIHRLRHTVYMGNPYRKMKMGDLISTFYGKDICACPECSGRMLWLPRGQPITALPSLIEKMNSAMC